MSARCVLSVPEFQVTPGFGNCLVEEKSTKWDHCHCIKLDRVFTTEELQYRLVMTNIAMV